MTGLTLSHIQQRCSRRLWKCLLKHMKNPHKWRYNNWRSWKHCGIRINCSLQPISSFAKMFSKVVCCRVVKERLYVGKGLRQSRCYMTHTLIGFIGVQCRFKQYLSVHHFFVISGWYKSTRLKNVPCHSNMTVASRVRPGPSCSISLTLTSRPWRIHVWMTQ